MQVAIRWQQQPVRRCVLRRAALRYARHGWPIVPGAALVDGRYVCGPLCPTVACHPAINDWEDAASSDSSDVLRWWERTPFSILLCTGLAFDVIDVPASIGAPATRHGRPGPVAVSPSGRWMFLVRPGAALRGELAARADLVQHRAGSWIPAPPTRTPAGPVRWTAPLGATGWDLPDPHAVQRLLVSQLGDGGSGPASLPRCPARC